MVFSIKINAKTLLFNDPDLLFLLETKTLLVFFLNLDRFLKSLLIAGVLIAFSNLFSYFKYGFTWFCSTGDSLVFASDRITKAFNSSRDKVWHAAILHKLRISDPVFDSISIFLVVMTINWFWIESPCNNIQLMMEFLKTLILVLHYSYYSEITFLKILLARLLYTLIIHFTFHVWAYVACDLW